MDGLKLSFKEVPELGFYDGSVLGKIICVVDGLPLTTYDGLGIGLL